MPIKNPIPSYAPAPKKLHILIAEDDPLFGEVVKRLVEPIMGAFPGSKLTIVTTLPDALDVIASVPHPDVALMDLTYQASKGRPQSSAEETLKHLEWMEDHTAVVIVTGRQESAVRQMIAGRPTPIVEKSEEMVRDKSILIRAIQWAVQYFQRREWERKEENLKILSSLTSHGQ